MSRPVSVRMDAQGFGMGTRIGVAISQPDPRAEAIIVRICVNPHILAAHYWLRLVLATRCYVDGAIAVQKTTNTERGLRQYCRWDETQN
tara:strand:- start:78 stop:344 length:267 start_codon:yes stop_codon:yes gene_type:complete